MELIIDNYDSFTYNLYQYMGTLNPDIQVIRNDAITVEGIRKLQPDHLILSPGPGRPCDAGVCEPALRELKGEFPILGVCLGHQAIGEVFGGTVTYARQLMHGKQSTVILDRTSPFFKGLPEQILVGAGLQTLLLVLLPLLPLERKVAGLEAPGFPQAEQIFHLMGWETCAYDPADPKGDWPGLLMISPANPYKGRALTEKERNNLIVATQLERVYLLEDDYNGEFRYLHRPTPALHSFGNREQIIYLGSFSRTMLPSLRISFLVLPEKLLPAYRAIAGRYNQTSSTVEQLALAAYIEEGHLTRHIRKLRTLYRIKSRLLQEALTAVFGDQVRLLGYGSGLHLHIALDRPGTAEELAARALEKGVRVIPVRGTEPGRPPEFLLSFAGIGEEKIRAGVEALREALEG